MSGMVALARHSLRRSRTLLAVLAAVLGGFEILLVAGAAALQESGTMGGFASVMPPFVREMFGDALAVFMSFAGFVAFGYFHPMIVAALSAFVIAVATEPVAEIETRMVDVVLARPLPRAAVIGRTTLLLVALPVLLIGIMIAATFASLAWLAPPGAAPRATLVLSLAVNLWALLECVGAVALAVAAASHRRATAAGGVGIAMLALFFLDYMARVWKPAQSVVWLSPFHYFDAMAMVMGRVLPAAHLAVLAVTAAAAMALAFLVYSRRDL